MLVQPLLLSKGDNKTTVSTTDKFKLDSLDSVSFVSQCFGAASDRNVIFIVTRRYRSDECDSLTD